VECEIKDFIESGDVCKVIGHVWEVSRSYKMNNIIPISESPKYIVTPFTIPRTRTCKICGIKQKEISKTEKVEVEREIKEWVDIED